MLRSLLCGLAAALAPLACNPGVSVPIAGEITLADDVVRRLSHGVFEVVIPMPGDGATTYTTPLPFDLLPLSLRGQKFLPIGTAFAVSPTRFVTAAHVILPTRESGGYLRDATGATFEIARIVRLSQYRDIAMFELVQRLPDVVPMETRASVALGDAVLTVGNASGQGVVARGGVVTSFTLEEVDGQWRFIRFTSPASPGNSGGPLVDASGRVLGIVVRKSPAENLNYAVPVAELEKLPEDFGDLSRRGLTISEDHHETRVDWSFRPHLPISPTDLKQAIKASFDGSRDRWYAEFDAKFGSDIFPEQPGLKTFLLEPNVPSGLGQFAIDGNHAWSISHPDKFVDAKVAPGQIALLFEGADKTTGQILLHRSRTPLAKFFESPMALADAVVHNYSWTIAFAGRPIGIESLGAPADSERWVDDYGRPWFTFVWRVNRTSETVLFDCLTNPGGWACYWQRISSPVEDAARFAAKRNARRVTFSYYGRIRDWVEFLALPDLYKPKILSGAHVALDDGLTVNLGPMVGDHVNVPSLSADSILHLYVTPDPHSLHQERLYETVLLPRVERTYAFGVQDVLAPTPERPASEASLWAKLHKGIAPFDNQPAVEAKTMNAIKRAVIPAGASGDRIDLEFCRNPVDSSKAELQAACGKFQSALRIGAGP